MYAVNNSDVWLEGCRNSQLLIADRVDPAGMFEFKNLMPRFPIPEGYDSEDALFADAVLAGHGQAVPQRVRRAAPRAGRVRDLDHLPDGLPRLLPGRRRLHQLGEEQRRGGRPWPGQRRGQHRRLLDGHHRPRPAGPRADLRAVPEPRADLDARHRHRLRRTRPGRRHQVRHPEVRQRQGRPDHHLRHDQGEGRHQGLHAGPRVPLRPRRPDHQGLPAGGHGQGHPAVRHLRRGAPAATTRRASCGTSTRPRQRSSRSSTPPGASRG